MNVIDIILGIFLIVGLVGGYRKGLLIEVASLIALIAGIYGAIHFSYIAGDHLKTKLDWSENYINLVAFVATFAMILLAVSFLGKILTKIVDMAALGTLNRIAGAAFGALKIGVILGAVLIFFHKTNNKIGFVSEDRIETSILYKPVKDLGGMVFDYVLDRTEDTDIKIGDFSNKEAAEQTSRNHR
ncbi:MAG: CvpA family protein [Flavobacteriaceae bacterium]|nr:CvpA family protein [Flavobacteriaceae bacterium]